ncbi:MAG: HK97 family phage prohead protease [Prevotella sp.]|nr:HK97 family phage prohead protease [Prevotella sp.]
MNKLERQIELQVSNLHIREAEDGQKSRTVEGYAVVFGVRSVNLTPWSSIREVYEIMEPGCITNDLLNRSDVVLTAFHNNQIILGRWRQGKGTLTLSLDERGLKISCTLADTRTADELLTSIERGDISGMSFAFTADEEDNENGVSYERTDTKTKDGKEVWLRHVKKVTGLYDVTIAGHPAYTQTSIEAREAADKFFDQHCPKQETEEEKQARQQREAEEAVAAKAAQEQKEREEREQQEHEALLQRECEMMAQRQRNRQRRMTAEILESLSY